MKGKHAKRLVKVYEKLQQEEGDSKSVKAFLDEQQKIMQELTGMTEEELDDLLIEEKNKILAAIMEKMEESLGFTRSLQKPGN